ncbi:hypothetical protein ACIQAC_29945 [Streptomyces sp. NPDC088387]|uniref:hypothetical protein n=1 Tax=Streptomyces sp. NPDC088387 TaxID=3365859 RepID=UPI0038146F5D
MAHPRRTRRIITRLVEGRVCAYDLATEELGVLSPVMVWGPSLGDEVVDHTVATHLQRAYYTTLDAVVCVATDGDEVWRYGLEPQAAHRRGHRPSCVMSSDEGVIWVYRPDAMAGRNRPDQWVALDGGSGAVVAQVDLKTVGHGGTQLLHQTTGHVLLDVGEGQDGSVVHRASLTDSGLHLFAYPWDDRCLIDLSPDGSRFMTVHHGQTDMAIHAYPHGEVVLTLGLDDFGHDPDEVFVEWSGGYLSPDTVIVTVAGETEDEREWFRHYRVEVSSGRLLAELDTHADNPYDVQPLGDRSWLTTDPSGHPIRWSDG